MFVGAWCGLVFGVSRVSGLGCGLIAVIVGALVGIYGVGERSVSCLLCRVYVGESLL